MAIIRKTACRGFAATAIGLLTAAVAAAPLRAQGSGGATATPDAGSDGDPVTYSDVLADPDDPATNYRYAQRLIAQGSLNRAAASLERILMLTPDADRIRLLYGVVLVRLGNDGEALRELEAVNRSNLAAEDQRTLDRALARVRRAQRRISGGLGVTAGVHVDSNRNAFPEDGTFQVALPALGTTRLDAAGSANADWGQYLLLDGRATVATDWQRVPEVTVEAAGLRDNQVEEDALDLISGLASLRTTYYGDGFRLAPRLSYRHLALAGERYLRETAARLRLSHKLTADRTLVAFVEGTGVYSDYDPVARAPFANEQTGPSAAGELGATYAPTERLDLTATYRFERKFAREDFEAFDEHRGRLSAIYVPGPGISLSAEGFAAWRTYDAPDTFVTTRTIREDREVLGRLGATVTVPRLASALGVSLPDRVAENLQLSVFGQLRDVDSNLPNFSYRNYRTEFAITKRFAF